MTRDGYLGAARLAWHPAFSYRATALACPICRQFITLNHTVRRIDGWTTKLRRD